MVSLTVTSGDSPHRACFKQRNCQHSHSHNQENKLNLSTNDKGPGLSSQGDLHDICWSKNYNHNYQGHQAEKVEVGTVVGGGGKSGREAGQRGARGDWLPPVGLAHTKSGIWFRFWSVSWRWKRCRRDLTVISNLTLTLNWLYFTCLESESRWWVTQPLSACVSFEESTSNIEHDKQLLC